MSELNIFGLREYDRKDIFEDTTDEIHNADRFYIMHEADKVIADLIEKNERLSDDCLIKASNTFREIEKEIRHHEYKRCLAMAEWCNANCMHTVLLIGHKIMPHWEWRIKTNYWYKWRKIWFEISRKFKEVK